MKWRGKALFLLEVRGFEKGAKARYQGMHVGVQDSPNESRRNLDFFFFLKDAALIFTCILGWG